MACVISVVTERCCGFWVFFFKQKTAYEMRISDWSSDVCSSDLQVSGLGRPQHLGEIGEQDRFRRRERGQGDAELAAVRCHRRVDAYAVGAHGVGAEIGRASCRERVGQYVSIWVADVASKKKKTSVYT